MCAHEVEEIFSVRSVPWHGLGNILPSHPQSAHQVMVAAGLNWQVTELPVEVPLPNGERITAPDKKAIVRLSDNALLSVMGGTYTPIQPRELVDFALALLEVDKAEFDGSQDEPPILFETGMSLAGGRVNVLVCKVPKDIQIGGEDPVDLYLAFVTSHDGSLRFGVHATPVRVVCRNTLNTGLKAAVQSWSVKHTPGATTAISEARRTLKLTWQYADAFESEMNALLDQEYTKRQFEQMVKDLFPKPAGETAPFSREQYSMIGLLESSPTILDPMRYTRWGAFNAVTEHFDWSTRFNSPGEDGPSIEEKRTAHTLFGKAKSQADRAFAYLSR